MNIIKKLKEFVLKRYFGFTESAAELEAAHIFYINGPDMLPPPLEADEEAELIGQIEQDEAVRNIFIERNLRLVVYIAKLRKMKHFLILPTMN